MMHDVRAELWCELTERNWTPNDLALAMGGDVAVNLVALDFLMTLDDASVRLGEQMAAQFGRAFGNAAADWLALEAATATER